MDNKLVTLTVLVGTLLVMYASLKFLGILAATSL